MMNFLFESIFASLLCEASFRAFFSCFLPRLARRLGERLHGLELRVSQQDKDLLRLA